MTKIISILSLSLFTALFIGQIASAQTGMSWVEYRCGAPEQTGMSWVEYFNACRN